MALGMSASSSNLVRGTHELTVLACSTRTTARTTELSVSTLDVPACATSEMSAVCNGGKLGLKATFSIADPDAIEPYRPPTALTDRHD